MVIGRKEREFLYNITCEHNGVYSITFESWVCPKDSFDPVFPFARACAELSHAELRIIDDFFEYEISCEDFCAVLCWSGGFSVMAYAKREKDEGLAFSALRNACAYMNGEQM